MVVYEFLKQNNNIIGFRTNGHAEFAAHGEDPICAGISVLTINTINTLDDLTQDKVDAEFDEESGYIDFRLMNPSQISREAKILLDALHYGIQGIQDSYGHKFIKITVREV